MLAPHGRSFSRQPTVGLLSCSDDIAIFGPLLDKSDVLTDETLFEIANKKGQHHRSAIAGRTRIGESVTDALVDRGNSDVVLKVVSNEGARLSELGFVKLVNRAKSDRNLAAALAVRKDLPPELQPFLDLALA